MPVSSPHEDDPILRPLVTLGRVLTIVIKGTTDELEHLKMKQLEIQVVYNKHDVSLGLRKRKAIEKSLEEI